MFHQKGVSVHDNEREPSSDDSKEMLFDRKKLLEKIFFDEENYSAEEIQKKLTHSRGREIFELVIIFNDSTGMAGTLYFIPTGIFASINFVFPICIFVSIGAALLFSYSLYNDKCNKEKQSQKLLLDYKSRVEQSIHHQTSILEIIAASCDRDSKYIIYTNQTIEISERLTLSSQDAIRTWESDFLQSFLKIPIPDDNEEVNDSFQKLILFIRTTVNCTGTLYAITKLIFPFIATAIGINLTAPFWAVSVVIIILGYSVPLSYGQYKYNERDSKYIKEIESLKTHAFNVSKKRDESLVQISSRFFSHTNSHANNQSLVTDLQPKLINSSYSY